MGEELQIQHAHRKRMIEFFLIVLITGVLLVLSRLETRLFELSESLSQSREFISTIIYFGMINFDIILILLLSFLVFRNIAKLILERKRGVLGSRLRTKLVVSLVLFAFAPTVLIFFISSQFITASFDKWFSERVRSTVEQAKEASGLVYEQTQEHLETLIKLASQRLTIEVPNEIYLLSQSKLKVKGLDQFTEDYNIDSLIVFDAHGVVLWPDTLAGDFYEGSDFVFSSFEKFYKDPSLTIFSSVIGEKESDVVKGIAPIYDPSGTYIIGAIFAQEVFNTNIVGSIQAILSEFASLRPGAELIKLSFMIMMAVVTMLIIFSAVWLGFYVARGITNPIQSLAYATRQVAQGNYRVQIEAPAHDEIGVLVSSFNQMTGDLQKHKRNAIEAQTSLEESNEELERRRQYMEIVLKNISSGVIALDEFGRTSTVNSAAEKLLGIEAKNLIGKRIDEGIGRDLSKLFWGPIQEAFSTSSSFNKEIDLVPYGKEVTLLVEATKIFDENGIQLGSVIVFEDAREKVRAQRVAAWREVAKRIAHEIKNPLTPIKLSTQRILRKFHDKFDGRDKEIFTNSIETILLQVDSLRNLVNEFSKFARLPEINPEMIDVVALIKEQVLMFESSYPSIKFDISKLEVVPDVFIDKEQFKRVFINLITNSIAAVEGAAIEGEISFISRYDEKSNQVLLEVGDNGPGIPAKLRERVLEPYFSTKDDGTGLGLAIVNQIVSDHGGYLRIIDNVPRGIIVSIELPVPQKDKMNPIKILKDK